MKESAVYWLWLRLLWPLGNRKTMRILEDFGSPEALFAADASAIRALSYLSSEEKETILLKDLSAARAEENMCRTLGVFILAQCDPEYPKELLTLPDPPILFYGKGDPSILSMYPKLTVVGTRRATPDGMTASLQFSRELAAGGVVIVSGMAEGIDGAAHSGALRARGKTVALLGCGIDVPYPASNLTLKDEVGEKGLLLSEFPLGTAAFRTNFPYRNRVLSALSDGTLVVEAGRKSGALITAHGALDEGKSVYALPWSVDHIAGMGGNELIRSGGAQMVLSATEILKDLLSLPREKTEDAGRNIRSRKVSEVLEAAEPKSAAKPRKASCPQKPAVSPKEEAILSAIGSTDSFDRIQNLCGIPTGELTGLLVMLEIKGLIKKEPGKRYYLK